MPRPWIYLAFFLSGLSGLVNEVVWSRLFVYTMGSTHLSIAVVVAVFMGGLALGSLLGGRLADGVRSPLALYGLLAGLAGLLASAVAPLLWLLEPLVGVVYRLHDGQPSHALFTAAKALVCGFTMLLPATLMGATLPALARHLSRGVHEVGSRLGALYAVNTLGAVAGAAAAGFLLIPRLGLGLTLAAGAGLDIAVGAAVLLACGRPLEHTREALAAARGLLRRAPREALPASTAPVARDPGAAAAAPWLARTVLLAFAVSGFVNMCLQMGWTRALIIATGNSTYAFSLIVGVFILGLAVGGWIAGLFADRVKDPAEAFGWVLVGAAAASLLTIPWLGLAPVRFAHTMGLQMEQSRAEDGGFSFIQFMAGAALWEVPVIFPATVFMGMTFPLAARVWALHAPGLGRAVGFAYAVNTLGAILGTALPGFVLMRLLGRTWGLLYLSVALGFLAGAAVLCACRPRWGSRLGLLGAAAICLLFAFFTRPHGVLDVLNFLDGRTAGSWRSHLWHPVLYALGSYNHLQYANRYLTSLDYARDQVQRYEAVYYRDGEAASVAVLKKRSTGFLSLNISGKTDASTGATSMDEHTQLLLGHLPVLAHPRPRTALTLGLGGGMTLGALTLHPEVEEIDLLEISPEVEEAARLHFGEANHWALENSRVRKIIGDGRNHLAHTARKYDIISSEPSNFWIAGLGSLFTEEFYRLCLDRLEHGGLMCQWVYTYRLRMDDYHLALRTFLKVFPHALVCTVNYGDTVLLGGREPIVFDHERLRGVLVHSAVRKNLEVLGIAEPADLFRYVQGVRPDLLSWVGTGPTNRDLFPLLEYTSPLGFYDRDAEIHPLLCGALPGPLPGTLFRGFGEEELARVESRRQAGRTNIRFYHHVYFGRFPAAVEEYEKLVKLGDAWLLDGAARELSRRADEMGPQRGALLARARKASDNLELAGADNFRALSGDAAEVLRYQAAAQASPDRWEPHLGMAGVKAAQGRTSEALAAIEAARKRGGPAHKLSLLQGVVIGMQGDLARAEELIRASLGSAPEEMRNDRGEAWYNLGFCLESQGKLREAVDAYQKAVDLENDPPRAQKRIQGCLDRLGQAGGEATGR